MNGKVLDLLHHSSQIRRRQGAPLGLEARDVSHRAGAAAQEQLAIEAVLAAVARRLADTSAPEILRAMETSLGELAEALGCNRCTFSELIAGDHLNVLCTCAAGNFEPLPGGRYTSDLPWFLGQLRSGRTVALSNLPDDLPADAVQERAHCRQIGLRSCLAIPVRVGRRITSVFTLSAMRHAREWPPEAVARLTMLGQMLAGVLALARAEEETRVLRQRAWHADRVQRVSLLAAAIARELNQPVTAILRNAQAGLKTLSRDDADPHALRDILESVVREDTRAAETIRTMRNPRVEAALVCVIDDDPAARLDLLRLLGEKGWQAKAYASADAFLAEQPPGAEVACVLLDIPMPDRCGLELQRQLVLRACAPGVIFISGHGDVATGVEAMKLGAADFLVKPVDAKVLVEAVGKAVAHYQARREQVLSQSSLMRRVSSLSTRERQIMEHVIEGRLNKQIAADLLITEQTVKQHRGRVMDKMEVKSVAQLVRACEATGLFPALK